jgi:hypothetical protein
VIILKELKQQPFYDKLTPSFQKKLPDLIDQVHTVSTYKKLENFSIFFAAIMILTNIKSFMSTYFSLNAFLMIALGGISIALVESASKEPKNKLKKTTDKIKNSLIVKVCTCKDYCTCKEDFVSYMKERDIKVLD